MLGRQIRARLRKYTMKDIKKFNSPITANEVGKFNRDLVEQEIAKDNKEFGVPFNEVREIDEEVSDHLALLSYGLNEHAKAGFREVKEYDYDMREYFTVYNVNRSRYTEAEMLEELDYAVDSGLFINANEMPYYAVEDGTKEWVAEKMKYRFGTSNWTIYKAGLALYMQYRDDLVLDSSVVFDSHLVRVAGAEAYERLTDTASGLVIDHWFEYQKAAEGRF